MYHHNRLVARCAWRWVQSSRATGATAWYTCCPHTQSSQRHKEGSAGGAAGALPSSLATASVVVVVAGSVYSSSGEGGGGGCRTFCSGSGTHDSTHSGVKEETSSTTTAASAPASARRTAPTAIVFCGPSGAGKSTLIHMLQRDFPDAMGFSVSHTTRRPRPGEVDGVDYHFVERRDMERSIAQGEFIEHALVHDNLYGTSLADVQRVAANGRVCVLDIDIQGVKSCQALVDFDAVYIAILPPSLQELERRLRRRGTETKQSLQTRLRNARSELAECEATPFDVRVVNDDKQRAYRQLKVFAEPLLRALPATGKQ